MTEILPWFTDSAAKLVARHLLPRGHPEYSTDPARDKIAMNTLEIHAAAQVLQNHFRQDLTEEEVLGKVYGGSTEDGFQKKAGEPIREMNARYNRALEDANIEAADARALAAVPVPPVPARRPLAAGGRGVRGGPRA